MPEPEAAQAGMGIGDLMLFGVDVGATHAKARMYYGEGGFPGGVHRPPPARRLTDGGAEAEKGRVLCSWA